MVGKVTVKRSGFDPALREAKRNPFYSGSFNGRGRGGMVHTFAIDAQSRIERVKTMNVAQLLAVRAMTGVQKTVLDAVARRMRSFGIEGKA